MIYEYCYFKVMALLRKNKAFTEYQPETQVALVKYMEYLR